MECHSEPPALGSEYVRHFPVFWGYDECSLIALFSMTLSHELKIASRDGCFPQRSTTDETHTIVCLQATKSWFLFALDLGVFWLLEPSSPGDSDRAVRSETGERWPISSDT